MSEQLELINPPELGKHSGFSHAVKAKADSLLFVAGMVGSDATGNVVSPDFVAQFEQALANVVTAVRAAGGEPENIARFTIYVLDRKEYLADPKRLGAVYRRHMGRHYPAMTAVEVRGFVEEDAKVELEATAAL